jgi:hypothetical protein
MSEKPQSTFVTEILKRYDVEPAVEGQGLTSSLEGKLLASDLMDRIIELDALLPGESPPSKTMVNAVFAHCGELMELSREVASRSGAKLDATLDIEGEAVPVYDFSFPTYDQFLKAEAAIMTSLQQSEGAPEAEVEQDPEREERAAGGIARKVISKIFSALGVTEAAGGVYGAVKEVAGRDIALLVHLIKEKEFNRAKRPLNRILRKLLSRQFRRALIERVGSKTAMKIVGKISARLVPGIGWAIFLASLAWAFAEQF